MAKRLKAKHEKQVAQEVRRRLEVSRRKDATLKSKQSVDVMPFPIRMKYEAGKVVKHSLWLVDNAGVGWANVGVGERQFIALMFDSEQWELVDDELRRKQSVPTIPPVSHVEVVPVG